MVNLAVVREQLANLPPTPQLSKSQTASVCDNIKKLLIDKKAVLIAHYYVAAEVQQLAEETGGMVGDSLEMAKFGAQHSAPTLAIAGVRFMGESAKILSPNKRVLMPTLQATCSLDLSCPADDFIKFRKQHPERTAVVYVNTSAAVKRHADWVVTSSIALQVIEHLDQKGEKILWAPDKYLGAYLQRQTGVDMLMWDGACIVHEEFKAQGLRNLKHIYPQAAILAHPESPAGVLALADVVGSTSQLLEASRQLSNPMFIVATDKGIFYKMRSATPNKTFIEAPTAGEGATCKSCAHCPWMGLNSLRRLESCLQQGTGEIVVNENDSKGALVALQRMMKFASN